MAKCPFLIMTFKNTGDDTNCLQKKCEWWHQEYGRVSGCAVIVMADCRDALSSISKSIQQLDESVENLNLN